ncbi:RICIN domain-containing protein [Streptomyces sp. NPDC054794]
MSLWTSLEPASATVDPGGSTTVRLRLRNTADVVDEYRIEPVGDIAPWTTVEPAMLRLYPGTTGTVELTFAPPRTPDATAGPNPYAVRITPTEHPEAVTVPEGNLTITPFSEVRAELVPPTVKGRFRARPRLAIDNIGNTTLTASLSGGDNGDELSYDILPSNVQIKPGRAAFVNTTLKPRKIIWFGSKQQRPYKLAVQRSGVAPLEVDGTYIQRGFLPGRLATALGVLLALSIAFVMLWIAYKPQVRSSAAEQLKEAAASTLPQPSSSERAAPSAATAPSEAAVPSSAPDPAAEPKASEAPKGSGGGGGAKPPTAKKKPQQRSVSNVLLRLRAVRKCVDTPGRDPGQRGGPANASTCNPSTEDNERWNLEVVYPTMGPGGSALFQIRQVRGRQCIDLPGLGAKPAGTALSTYGCNGTTGDNQLWWLDAQDRDTYWIRNYSSNSACLDMAGSGGGDPARLVIHECADGEAQRWQIVNPTEPDWQIVHP